MTWFKVDDGLALHPKAIAAGNAALGLWVRAGSWCGANLTDGYLPKSLIGTLSGQRRDAEKLVTAGLWVHAISTPDAHQTHTSGTRAAHVVVTCADGGDHTACGKFTGYMFHEWGLMQPTKAEVLADREANKARQQAWRDRKRNAVTNGVSHTVSNGVTNGAPTRPDPLTTPLRGVVPREKADAKTGTRVPANFKTTPGMLAWALENAPNVDRALSTKKFLAHYRSAAGPNQFRGDWIEAWKAWLLGDQQKALDRPQQFTTSAERSLQNGAALFAKYAAEENYQPLEIES